MCKFAKKNHSKTLFYPWTGESYGQETLLAPPTDKQTCNFDRKMLLKPTLLPITSTGTEP